MSRSVRKPSKEVALALVVSALASLLSAGSRGEDAAPRVAFVWKAAPEAGCAADEQIRAEVDRLSETPLVTSGQRFEIEAMAFEHEGSWVASVALRDARGRVLGGREVTGAYVSCRDLDTPVALVVATLVDELREQPAPASPAAAAPAPPGASEPRALGVGAFVTGALGLVPRLTLGAGANVELPFAWPLVFAASAYLPGRELDAAGRGVWAISFHGGAAVCPRLAGRRHVLRLCGGAQAGAVVARSVDLSEPRRSALPLVMLGVEPQLVLGLTASWALQISLGAHWLPVRPRFHWEIDGAGARSLEAERFALIARIGVIDFLR